MRHTIALLATLLATAGAADQTWSFTMSADPDGKGARLDLDKVVVLFAGEAYNGSGSGSFTVSDAGGSTTAKTGSLEIASANGVVTVAFRKRSFTITDQGAKLKIGEQVFDLAGEKKTIVIDAAGAASVATAAKGAEEEAEPPAKDQPRKRSK